MSPLSTSENPAAPAPPAEAEWGALIPDEQWSVLIDGTEALTGAGVPFLLAGAAALATYTGHWRNTKDIDVIVHARDAERAKQAMLDAGFADYFDEQAYDRTWIFRAHRDGVLFDVIWDLPNHRVQIDALWFERAVPLRLRDRDLRVAPAEEVSRVKLYVMQRERCDWVDVINVLAAAVERIDWEFFVRRMGRDLPLLQGALSIFNWLCPGRARALPVWLRAQFALPLIEADDPAAMEERRVRLFDSRPWFALHQPTGQPLER